MESGTDVLSKNRWSDKDWQSFAIVFFPKPSSASCFSNTALQRSELRKLKSYSRLLMHGECVAGGTMDTPRQQCT